MFLYLLVACFSLVFVRPTQAADPPPVIAIDAKLENGATNAKLSFTLSGPVHADAYVLAHPQRVIVDLDDVDFRIDQQANILPASTRPGKAALIRSFRCGPIAPHKSRIVVDLSAPAAVTALNGANHEAGTMRLTLDLTATDETSFAANATYGAERQARRLAALAPMASPLTTTLPRNDKPVIVLDAGHGGIDTGAISASGIMEKDIALDFVRRLAARLDASGRYTVVKTREGDIFIPLGERVRLARQQNAALFLSVHADTLDSGQHVSGATVYTVSTKASDAEAARIAESENRADSAAGLEVKEDGADVSDILFDLTRRETRAFSHIFAQKLVESWRSSARLNKNPQRSAGFVVLKAPDVPSALLELGYLSSADDAVQLSSKEWRENASARVAAAIDAYFNTRQPPMGENSPQKAN